MTFPRELTGVDAASASKGVAMVACIVISYILTREKFILVIAKWLFNGEILYYLANKLLKRLMF